MALPLEPRRLWFIHMLAVTLAGVFIIVVLVGVVALQSRFISRFTVQAAITGSDLFGLAIHLSVGFVLAALLLQTIQPTLSRIPGGRKTISMMVLTLVAIWALVLLLDVMAPLFLVVAIGIAGILGVRLYRAMPASFTVVPLQPDDDEGGEEPAGRFQERDRAAEGKHTARFRYLTIARVLSKNYLLPLVSFPFIFFLGMLFSGFFNVMFGDSDLQFTNLTLGGYIMMAFLATPMGFLHHLDGLPISRKSLFACLILTPLMVLLIGYGSGRLGMTYLQQPVPLVEYQEEESLLFPSYKADDKLLRVPVDFCEIAWDGPAQLTLSPWGESHPPWEAPIFRGSRVVLYSPFSAPDSLRFRSAGPSRLSMACPSRTGRSWTATWRPTTMGLWLSNPRVSRYWKISLS
jgi:hypothetical protein